MRLVSINGEFESTGRGADYMLCVIENWYRCICRFSNSRSSHEIGRGSGNFSSQQQRGLYLELERERGCLEGSPPSDNVMFDNQCYATTPSSSNGNSDQDQPYGQRQVSNRHQHHHQVSTGIVFNRTLGQQTKIFNFFSKQTESTKCDTNTGLANLSSITGIWNAFAKHSSQRNGCRIIQFTHIRSVIITKYGKLR